jgi:hypothetical protein
MCQVAGSTCGESGGTWGSLVPTTAKVPHVDDPKLKSSWLLRSVAPLVYPWNVPGAVQDPVNVSMLVLTAVENWHAPSCISIISILPFSAENMTGAVRRWAATVMALLCIINGANGQTAAPAAPGTLHTSPTVCRSNDYCADSSVVRVAMLLTMAAGSKWQHTSCESASSHAACQAVPYTSIMDIRSSNTALLPAAVHKACAAGRCDADCCLPPQTCNGVRGDCICPCPSIMVCNTVRDSCECPLPSRSLCDDAFGCFCTSGRTCAGGKCVSR